MKIDEYEFPDDLYYHNEHCWAKVDGDEVLVGLNDFASKLAGKIKRVITLEEDDDVTLGKPFGTVSSGKWTGKLYSPISGEITEVNEDILDEPSLINESTYDEGWLIKVEPSDLDTDLGKLMKPGSDFEAWLKKEIVERKAEMEG
jgi:glycine cleavage system H protein